MGLMKPYDVAPYDYGVFPLPEAVESHAIANGSFDHKNGRLFISIKDADKLTPYRKAPVFLVYKAGNN